MVEEYLSECKFCTQNNVRKGISAPIGHIPVPEGSFKHLAMDYVDMIKSIRSNRRLSKITTRGDNIGGDLNESVQSLQKRQSVKSK